MIGSARRRLTAAGAMRVAKVAERTRPPCENREGLPAPLVGQQLLESGTSPGPDKLERIPIVVCSGQLGGGGKGPDWDPPGSGKGLPAVGGGRRAPDDGGPAEAAWRG